jgi:glutathione S-transferase
MKVLDEHLIGPKNAYLCGNQMTIADYFGASFVALGELIRGDYADYPNVERWLGNMKRLKNWKKVNEAVDGFAASLKDAPLQPL